VESELESELESDLEAELEAGLTLSLFLCKTVVGMFFLSSLICIRLLIECWTTQTLSRGLGWQIQEV